jgi:xanthosine utilization system XapX-like protein
MLAYPGGTSLNRAAAGYSLSQNFLSDLMTTSAWNGQPNTVSAVLAGTGMAFLAVAFIGFAAAVTPLLSPTGGQRYILRCAMAATILGGVGLVGAALVSPDWWMTLHLQFATLAVGSGVATCLLYGIGSWRQPALPRGMAIAWLGLALVLAGLFSMRWGPSIVDERGLMVQVISQKVAAVAILGTFFYRDIRKALKRAQRSTPGGPW